MIENDNFDNRIKCSFCGNLIEGSKLIGSDNYLQDGTQVVICVDCIEKSATYVSSNNKLQTKNKVSKDINNATDITTDSSFLKPPQIVDYLNNYVIGQDLAKKVLAVAIYNHYKRLNYSAKSGLIDESEFDCEIQKSNILLVGSTGVGKTLLASTLAHLLDVPFTIANATSLTESGFTGEDVENILVRLLQVADYDVEKAQKGIIMIDEIDKIGRKSESPSLTKDPGGEGVQQSLLKIIEGDIVNIPPKGGRKHPEQEFIQIDTTNILFIVGGAFDGMQNVIKDRTEVKELMGFKDNSDKTINKNKDDISVLKDIESHDFVKFGMIPELIGRLPVIVALEDLDEYALIRILTEPKNALIKQYQKLLHMDGVELIFEEDALKEIASKAIFKKTGARGLRSIVEECLLDVMFELPIIDDVVKCVISKDVVLGLGEAEFIKR